jgi:2-oxoglutarate ferredoxin oxidoreductase subunit alpha
MVESINMAYMMELPMLIILVQRLGPSTGTATAGAQDDLRFLYGIISGGYPVPVFCISDIEDCWRLPVAALRTAVDLRTPVVLLTSKEMVMTHRTVALADLDDVQPVEHRFYAEAVPYRPYLAGDAEAPAFLPIGNQRHQVRLTASTHDQRGIIRHSADEALANTRRLAMKIKAHTPILLRLDEMEGVETLIVTYGITSGAALAATQMLREDGKAVSLLVARTLLPIHDRHYEILDRYQYLVFAEENVQGQFASMLFGERWPKHVAFVGDIGAMVRPVQIARAVCK